MSDQERAAAEVALDTGNRLYSEGNFDGAINSFSQGLALLPRRDTSWLSFGLLNGLGNAQRAQGRFDEARQAFSRALSVARTLDPRSFATGVILNNFGYLLLLSGDLEGAGQHLEQGLAILSAVAPSSEAELECLDNLATYDVTVGDLRRAVTRAQRALKVSLELGRDRTDLATRRLTLGLVYQQLGDYEASIDSLDRALGLFRSLRPRSPEVVRCLQGLAESHEALGNQAGADRYWLEAQNLAAGLR